MLDFDSMTWPCMVCGDERPDALISVAYRPAPGLEEQFPNARVNVRYCNDRPGCVAVAYARGPWTGRPRQERAPRRWNVHACILDADCRRFDLPNRWHLNTPFGSLIVGIGKDNWIQGWLPWKGYRKWHAPIVWHPAPHKSGEKRD